nr:sensor histidine kinase [uncultured Cellulosilyticum sp.]
MNIRKQRTSNMNRHIREKRVHSISWVLMRSYFITMSISLTLGVFLFYFVLQKEVSYKFQVGDAQALNTFSYFLSRKMSESERISYNLAIDDRLQNILRYGGEKVANGISELLKENIIQWPDVKSIHIIDANGKVFSEYQEPTYTKDDALFISQFDLNKVESRKGGTYWGIGKNVLEGKSQLTFYMARLINSKEDMKPLGYIVVYLEPTGIEQGCNQILRNISLDVMIRDEVGNVVCMPNNNRLQRLRDEIIWEEKQYYAVKEEHKNYHYIVQPIDILDGYIVGMNHEAQSNNNISIILIFAVMSNIIFIIMASLIIKRKVVSPLKYIATKARVIGKEKKLDVKFTIEDGYSEVYDIIYALDEMMEQINELVIDVAQREKLQKRLELSIINHQVKPHFLYNTLNTASILVAIEEQDAAIELIKTLAKYYRACLSSGEDCITIAEELEIVKEYIKIAIIRKPNSVVINYDIDEATLKFKIPKITIQSLVENSIKYGVKKVGVPVQISITTRFNQDENKMMIIVEDDGNGISKEVIQKVLQGEKLDVKSGFGLKAMIARLLLYYDVKSTKEVIKIDSKCGEYTKIILMIPI